MPSIDISNGKCVRLYKGLKGTEKIYFDNPLEALDFWASHGAKRIHIIDLNGAWGLSNNKELLVSMIKRVKHKVKVQVGGGIRTKKIALELIEIGADRIILGTKATETPEIISQLLKKVESEQIIIALDYSKGKLMTQGWTKKTNLDPFSLGEKVIQMGAGYILFSCIDVDGTLLGPDFQNIKKMAEIVGKKHLYVAGGFGTKEDLYKLKRNIEVKGVIIGRALYEKRIPFSIFKNSLIFNS
ncbi:MAG: 1-(5-phosphoribosyl)-5-[(5-phosphoribosylamino)methylideneamino] imidazole-4-carboxamide isomerase [Promethearchaeia archaeon]